VTKINRVGKSHSESVWKRAVAVGDYRCDDVKLAQVHARIATSGIQKCKSKNVGSFTSRVIVISVVIKSMID
jgi:hypothetical protein